MFSFPILRRSVRARETEVSALSHQGGEGLLDKLSAIVGLHICNGEAELGASICKEANDMTSNLRLMHHGVSPAIRLE
jgi:hypothetical protein